MTRSLFDSSTHKQISDIMSLESGSALKHMATMATDPITKLPYQIMLTSESAKKSKIDYESSFKKHTCFSKDILEKHEHDKLHSCCSTEVVSKFRQVER